MDEKRTRVRWMEGREYLGAWGPQFIHMRIYVDVCVIQLMKYELGDDHS
jgi:hypothetical protein